MKVYINKFGQITDEKSDYEVELQGSYFPFENGYKYEIKSIIPEIPLKYIFSDKLLT